MGGKEAQEGSSLERDGGKLGLSKLNASVHASISSSGQFPAWCIWKGRQAGRRTRKRQRLFDALFNNRLWVRKAQLNGLWGPFPVPQSSSFNDLTAKASQLQGGQSLLGAPRAAQGLTERGIPTGKVWIGSSGWRGCGTGIRHGAEGGRRGLEAAHGKRWGASLH